MCGRAAHLWCASLLSCSPWRSQSVQGVFHQTKGACFLCPIPMSAPCARRARSTGCTYQDPGLLWRMLTAIAYVVMLPVQGAALLSMASWTLTSRTPSSASAASSSAPWPRLAVSVAGGLHRNGHHQHHRPLGLSDERPGHLRLLLHRLVTSIRRRHTKKGAVVGLVCRHRDADRRRCCCGTTWPLPSICAMPRAAVVDHAAYPYSCPSTWSRAG